MQNLVTHFKTHKKIWLFAGVIFALFLLNSQKISALSGSEFNAGRITDDAVFYNSNTMSPQDIQNFFNSKVPVCDTNGTQPHNGTTRAAYGASRGYPAPYTCLKDYSQSVPTVTNSGSDLCPGSIAGGTKSAATIVYEVSVACGVNPKVLIVLLQKEQSLVTDDWPWSIQYRSATGYGCPDTAPCDSEYYGFFNQVYQAAKAYKRYRANPANYNYRAGRNNTILWNPNAGCGTSTVFIENQATAGLYIYTPYRPNQAALNNLYGLGDSCSSYGNRNFWRMFSDWFGSTIKPNGEIVISGALGTSDTSPKTGQQLTFEYAVQNKGSAPVDSGVLWLCGDLNGKEFAGGSKRKVLAPGEVMYMNMTYTPQSHGVLKIRACGNLPNGPGYVDGYPYTTYNDHRERWDWVNGNPMVVAGAILSSNPQPSVGDTVTLAYAVQNTDTVNFDSGILWLCGDLNGKEFAGGSKRKVLAPGEIITISMQYQIQSKGALRISACGNLPNGPGWVHGYPHGAYLDHRERTYQVKDALRISGAVYVSDSNPSKSEPLNLGYVVKNYSTSNQDTGILWVCGDLNGSEFGGGSKRKILAPGEELVVNMTFTPSSEGALSVKACGNPPNGPGWVSGYPVREYFDHGQRTFTISN